MNEKEKKNAVKAWFDTSLGWWRFFTPNGEEVITQMFASSVTIDDLFGKRDGVIASAKVEFLCEVVNEMPAPGPALDDRLETSMGEKKTTDQCAP